MQAITRIQVEQIPAGGGCQIWHPKFRTYTDAQLLQECEEYKPIYSIAFFCEATATIHLYRA